jgi:hypothetical protein
MTMSDRESAYAATDKLLGDAMRLVTAGVDPDLASETVADALGALSKQAKALKAVDYPSETIKKLTCECGKIHEVKLPNHVDLAKAMAQTAKMIDETARLTQFCSGKADSRPDLGMGAGLPVDVLRALTNEQLQTVMGWISVNETQSQSIQERQ